jgi:hypothetical protein
MAALIRQARCPNQDTKCCAEVSKFTFVLWGWNGAPDFRVLGRRWDTTGGGMGSGEMGVTPYPERILGRTGLNLIRINFGLRPPLVPQAEQFGARIVERFGPREWLSVLAFSNH